MIISNNRLENNFSGEDDIPPEMEADPRLVEKLATLREYLAIPNRTSKIPWMFLYRSINGFDPRRPLAGKGYNELSSYQMAIEAVARDSGQLQEEDFLRFMDYETATGAVDRGFPDEFNPLVVLTPNIRVAYEFHPYGCLLQVCAPRDLLIDHNQTRRNLGRGTPYEGERRIYLYGPVNPNWIVGFSDYEEVEARNKLSPIDDSQPVSTIWTQIRTLTEVLLFARRNSNETNIRLALKNPAPEAFQKIPLEIAQAVKRALLLDGTWGDPNPKTFLEGVKPLAKLTTVEELERCLSAFGEQNLTSDTFDPKMVWEQVVAYIRREKPINEISDPFVKNAVRRIALNAVRQGKDIKEVV